MILACHNITKYFGEQRIVEKGSFHIEDREKAALVGINGTGKSTLLKIIMGELTADDGEVILAKGKSIGYLSQHQELNTGNTILEELRTAKADIIELEKQIRSIELELKSLDSDELEERLKTYHLLTEKFELANGYSYQSEIIGVLKGLGFSEQDFQKKVDALSGGQKTRVSSITWLETYLQNYSGAVLIVSHDRYFLNRVVTKVVELESGSLTTYLGNYSDYSVKKQQLRAARLKEYMNQQQEIKHQEEVIAKLRSFNREKSIKRAESREKMLAKMTPVEKPQEETSAFHLELSPSCTSGNDVLSISDLGKSFGTQNLFQHVDMEIKRGEHVAVIGDNGTGKTTLLKILNGLIPADHGSFLLGTNVHIGYYDQEHHVLHSEKNIFDEISDDYPDLTNTEIRNTLAAFLFTGDDVYKQIQDLSGGERGRVSLAKLMLSEANFLILDEPTNHLDIQSKEILEEALNHYSGTVLYVSHDRYFINQTATRILELSNHTFINYIGNYDYYLEKKDLLNQLHAQESTRKEEMVPSASSNKLDWQAQKEAQAKERKRQNDLKRTETTISELEERDSAIDQLMAQEDIYTDAGKCRELSEEKAEIQKKLEELYELWESLAE